jgi:LmbE family N-acetylglucosaminyl deacetylase
MQKELEVGLLRGGWRGVCEGLLKLRSRALDDHALGRSAMFFAPHCGDECLGCGGIIAQKVLASAQIAVVYMTDGAHSLSQMSGQRELRHHRSAQGREAPAVLGVHRRDLFYLGFPEAGLEHFCDSAVKQVVDLLNHRHPRDVFIPSMLEPSFWSSDHQCTTSILFKALAQYNHHLGVYEYPVWFWNHWPWIALPHWGSDNFRDMLHFTMVNAWGVRAALTFNRRVPLQWVLSQKREAVELYLAQMQNISPYAGLLKHQDVAGEDFARCFFGASEYYRFSWWIPFVRANQAVLLPHTQIA